MLPLMSWDMNLDTTLDGLTVSIQFISFKLIFFVKSAYSAKASSKVSDYLFSDM